MNEQGYLLLQAIGAVDDALIDEAAPNAVTENRRRSRRILAVAAGFVIVLLFTLILEPLLAPDPDETEPLRRVNAARNSTANPAEDDNPSAKSDRNNTEDYPTDIKINMIKDTDKAQLDMDITVDVLNLNDTEPIDPVAANDFKERTGMAFEDFHARLAGYTIDEVAALKAPTGNREYRFRDYVFHASQADTEININFSPFGEPLRDFFYMSDDLMTSTVGSTEVVITRRKESDYRATFSAHNLYFDVTAEHITESDFMDFLIALIKD